MSGARVGREPPRVDLGRLVEAVQPLAVLGDPGGVEVRAVVFHHAEVVAGSLFCCIPGARHDGHDYARAARDAGAVAFVCERSLGAAAGPAVQLVVAPGGARQAMARAACAFYGHPARAMRCVGVTGTDGKTTTTYLLRSILERYGWPTLVVGTLDGGRTTPEAPELQRRLAEARDAGVRACAIEVSSHALALGRVEGMRFDVGVFTNLSPEHLDFHGSLEAYFEAKASLFTPERCRFGVANADDEHGARLLAAAPIPMASFSLADAHDLEVGVAGSRFRLGRHRVHLRLGGVFNVRNALGAAVAARALGVEAAAIVEGLEAAAPVPGRFEAIPGPSGVTVVVDYAHTPAALEQVLQAARGCPASRSRSGRVIAVFGCGGERDRGKRPAMGAVAARLADLVVLTSDNPRSEDPLAIIGEIRAGMPAGTPHLLEVDRRAAIAAALRAARPGDVVVVAGKGHERSQEVAGRSLPFDDREVVRASVAALGLGEAAAR